MTLSESSVSEELLEDLEETVFVKLCFFTGSLSFAFQLGFSSGLLFILVASEVGAVFLWRKIPSRHLDFIPSSESFCFLMTLFGFSGDFLF